MSFIKKQSAGFYFTALSVIAAVVGMIFYLINCNTEYFRKFQKSDDSSATLKEVYDTALIK